MKSCKTKIIEKKNKKKLLALLGIGIFVVLGSTLAYFTTSSTITNTFKIGKYETEIIETFQSPDNWTPGTTTPKTIAITNKGTIDMAVRASYTEKWINANGVEIPLEDSDGTIAAVINFNTGWEKTEDGYFYYGTKDDLVKLKPNETTSSFISGVRFNENIKADLSRTDSPDGQTITYSSTGDGYDGATYILTIKIDTVQYDQALNFWQ